MNNVRSLGRSSECAARASLGFERILPDSNTMTREAVARKWNCSAATIDKYAD
jgi:hypothetical protein